MVDYNLWPKNPMSNLWSHMASQLAWLASIYSAPAELNATDFCFLLNQDTIVDHKLKQHPKVFFLSIALPSQSKSV
jgi:hypothetical protein